GDLRDFSDSFSETVWKIELGPESGLRGMPKGAQEARSVASWRERPTVEKLPVIFQTVSPRTPV
ncbi:MAG: hypothetical protein AVDCRST_MAG05-4944, partial [uncultured Rubrobacteraceae bacterium]